MESENFARYLIKLPLKMEKSTSRLVYLCVGYNITCAPKNKLFSDTSHFYPHTHKNKPFQKHK